MAASGPSPTFWVVLPFFLAVVWILPEKLERRDAAANIAWPRDPVPDHGRIVTIQHSPEEIERFVHNESNNKNLLVAPQVDLYYEALLSEDGDCSKAFVILPGTNSQTWFYHGLIDRMRGLGFCTLVFDWRSHGRSEDTPGSITTELFMLDAAAIIQKVFPNQPVHIWGFSLGGFVSYQLAIYKPELVKSVFVYGSHACFAHIPESSSECVEKWSAAKVFFSRAMMMRLIGLETEIGLLGPTIKLKHPLAESVQRYFMSLRMDQKVKTPKVWLDVPGTKTFGQLDRITCPLQHLAAEHEIEVTGATIHSMKLEAAKIAKAETPIMMADPAGEGYSHFAIMEEGGMDQMFGHMKVFYETHV